MTTFAADSDFEPDELAAYLDGLLRDECFRVDALLKDSATEKTQRVYFVGANGAEQGPYIRKYIDRAAGLGTVYRDLHAARRAGRRFRYLPAVYSYAEQGDCIVVLMEYAAGCSVRSLVERTDPCDRLALVTQVAPALCDAVTELHEGLASPVIHRDLTPSNVLCPPQDPAALTLIDLGISRQYKPGAAADTAYFGTRAYAPPEQYGFAQTDPRTDVYALGLTLFFCLTGRDPGPSDRVQGFADPAVPATVRAVIARAASLDARERYKSVRALKEAVLVALAAAQEHTAEQGEERPSVVSWPPQWVGVLWNIGVLACAALFVAACLSLAIHPLPGNTVEPPPYRVYVYAVFMTINIVIPAYLLLDRRHMAWRRRALGDHPLRSEMLWLLGALLTNWIVFGVATIVCKSFLGA